MVAAITEPKSLWGKPRLILAISTERNLRTVDKIEDANPESSIKLNTVQQVDRISLK
jgi:hypothetical protein